jgi:HAD superfamily hydrolase (TIGR01509 family)
MRQPVLIFDFGNVVGFFDYTKIYERFTPMLGIELNELKQRLQEGGFAELLIEFESGRIAPTAFADDMMAQLGLKIPYEEFVRAWEDIFWVNEPLARLIEFLKSCHYTLILGSNTNVLHFDHFRRQFSATFTHFDRLIASHLVGHMKPAREFYEACVEAAGVPAGACVFVDDIEENAEGARKAGLSAIRYIDTPTLIADLRRLGVEVPRSQV